MMNRAFSRRLTVLSLAAVAALGLSACTATPEAAEADPTASAPATQSVQEACRNVSAAVESATKELSTLDPLAAAADPEKTMQTFSGVADSLSTALSRVGNEEVGAAGTALQEDFTALRDALQTLIIDGDITAAGNVASLSAGVKDSLAAYTSACAS